MISPGNETRRAPTKIELKNANELQWRTPQVRGGEAGGGVEEGVKIQQSGR